MTVQKIKNGKFCNCWHHCRHQHLKKMVFSMSNCAMMPTEAISSNINYNILNKLSLEVSIYENVTRKPIVITKLISWQTLKRYYNSKIKVFKAFFSITDLTGTDIVPPSWISNIWLVHNINAICWDNLTGQCVLCMKFCSFRRCPRRTTFHYLIFFLVSSLVTGISEAFQCKSWISACI